MQVIPSLAWSPVSDSGGAVLQPTGLRFHSEQRRREKLSLDSAPKVASPGLSDGIRASLIRRSTRQDRWAGECRRDDVGLIFAGIDPVKRLNIKLW